MGLLFGALAFCQGVGEPTGGLLDQPSLSLLKRWGHGPGALGGFSMVVGLVWIFKPVLGLLTDFVPLWGRKRQGYLILAGAIGAASMVGLSSLPTPTDRFSWLLGWLAMSALAWSLADVVADAWLIDRGRDSGLIGRFQAVQWGASYLAGIVASLGGGWLSEHSREHDGFRVSGLAAIGTLLLASFAVREPRTRPPAFRLQAARRSLAIALRSPRLLRVGAFLFLWNFNPFSTTVLYLHMTRTLGFAETFYGWMQAVMAVGSILGCLVYLLIVRQVSTPALVRLSIVLGVLSTMAYGFVAGPGSALAVSLLVGMIYMLATLIQLDQAARACPPEAAGTVFALLMAVENLSAALSTGLGSWIYDRAGNSWGFAAAFSGLIVIGALFTGSSWRLLPGDRAVEIEDPLPGSYA